ncbi:hypothetical protein JHK84_043055 [Glycine max]|nr:hypothetical protein JHK84_043055 [Glycine max]
MLSGPFFLVFLGRCNGQTSLAFAVSSHLSTPSMPISQITQLFAKCGFTVEEFVALSGAHTVEFSHCFEFVTNLSNNTSSSYNPRYAQGLQKACADYKTNPTLSVFNDIMTSNKWLGPNMLYTWLDAIPFMRAQAPHMKGMVLESGIGG